jgi:hypothetical protein
MPHVPVSWGELLDKISILELKAARATEPLALANVRRELDALRDCEPGADAAEPGSRAKIATLRDALARVNLALWDIEDAIRLRERDQDFGAEFIALARSVYLKNDERAALKRQINVALESDLFEEKLYAKAT